MSSYGRVDDDAEVGIVDKASTIDDATITSSRFCFVRLANLVKWYHLVAFYFLSCMTICAYTFVNIGQRYLLEVNLDYPENEQGVVVGNIGFYSELVIIALITPWGVLSDKIGRRYVWAAGFFFMAVSFGAMPYTTTLEAFTGVRMIYATGAAAVGGMMTAVLSDYVFVPDKGIASGFMGLFSGCGALVAAFLLLPIPERIVGDDEGNHELEVKGGRMMYGAATIIVATACVAALLFLQKKNNKMLENRSVMPFKLLKEGFVAAYVEPRLGLAYMAGFVARGDAVVLTTFLAQWCYDYVIEFGDADGDFSDPAANTASGMVTGIAQTCALCFAIFAGLMATKLNSVLAVLISSFIALIGYAGMCFADNPTAGYGLFMACIVGIGEISVIVTSQALAAKYSPPNVRGSVGGTFGLVGSLGILICNKLGGHLYEWRPWAPFLIFAVFNGILLIFSAALYIYLRVKGRLEYNPLDAQDSAETVGFAKEDRGSVNTQEQSSSHIPPSG